MSYATKKPELMDTWGIPMELGGRVKIRPVRCRKPQCRACPHAFYAYHIAGTGAARTEKYLGTATAEGKPRQRYN
jgi:hypothetical protein